ncbi:MAG: 2-oxoglutarate dehydrogenase E1 subunit family protein, partial [Akkermansiaceae bacterium]
MNSTVSARLNADLLDEKYAQWCENPQSVEQTWSAFFEGFELGVAQLKKKEAGEAFVSDTSSLSASDIEFNGKVVSLVYNYRTLGHTQAQINPLDDSPELNPRLSIS